MSASAARRFVSLFFLRFLAPVLCAGLLPEARAVSVMPLRVSAAGAAPAESLEVPLVLPSGTTFRFIAPDRAWFGADSLEFTVLVGGDPGGEGVQTLVYVKDWDHFWYQILLPERPAPGREMRVKVDLSPHAVGWESRGHHGAWHARVLTDPSEVGVRFFGGGSGPAQVTVKTPVLRLRGDVGNPYIRNVRALSTEVSVYEKFEAAFEIPDRYANPFDPSQVSVEAQITAPGGRRHSIAAFYSQDYYRDMEGGREELLPEGRPCWRFRYAPLAAGRHEYRITVRDAFGRAEWGPGRFDAIAARSPGFVRVSRADPRYFEFDDGNGYFPIGHNIRSPYDVRHDQQFPWMKRWEEGSSTYARRFRVMAENGENFAEVWTAAWSLGLEWSQKWRGYHGVGQYNMMNAWELDRVIEEARKNGIRINLVVHNHGKFSTRSDKEWSYNPFNVECGGFLDNPEDYFTDPRALDSFRNLMRYMVARWGHSPEIFAWELWSELNLTGRSGEFYKTPEVLDWHRLMGGVIKEMDVNKHMVSTHYSGDYLMQNTAIVALAEMDLAPVDAYHGSDDPLYIVELMRSTADFNRPFGKPVLITEFGGSARAHGLRHIEDTLHAALWASVCMDLGGTPMLWWWHVIEEENLYPRFAALARFMEGEDRRGTALRTCSAVYDAGGEGGEYEGVRLRDGDVMPRGTAVWCMRGPDRAYGWIARTSSFPDVNPRGDPTLTALRLAIGGMDPEPGPLTVEFWDTLQGSVVSRTVVEPENGWLVVDVPPLVRDMAFKVKR
ncbi:MAG: DUF5060 domain-containing protein [Lentisphaerae bacterium]|nr:DUF5060 domain-containing protein [Lentisphaerota bacterium]